MSTSVEIPFPPRSPELRGARAEPPWVPMELRWEYKEVVRNVETDELPSEAELNALGADQWELAAVVRSGQLVHFYFKRERLR
jgi:hypothetical protein